MAQPKPSYYDEEPDDQQDSVNPPDSGNGDGNGNASADDTGTDEGQSDEQTALLPRAFFSGEPKIGDTCEVKIEKIFGDEIQVAYVPHAQSDETEAPAAAPATETTPAMGGGDTGGDLYG